MDVNIVLQELRMDVFGLAETFLQRNAVPRVAGYSWFGCNRDRGRKASGRVGLLVRDGLQAKLLKSMMGGTKGREWREIGHRYGVHESGGG